tara:strand:+ start:240 stop:887 length:648 start_codon:yes stop_codon:yes gene_type:complete
MKIRFKETSISLLSIILILYFFYFSINYFLYKEIKVINFIDSKINEDFEIEITNNLDNINNFLREYSFIENHLLKKEENEIYIQLKLKKPFAINNLTNEIIFIDNTTAPINYFKLNYLDSINLIDISQSSIYINNYLNKYYLSLSSLFDIDQIEYIDDRRYNLVLRNGKVVMLPKVIDAKLLDFIKNNIDLIDKSTNYNRFLDLRNFHNKTIRLK